jgi:hypothetical protein
MTRVLPKMADLSIRATGGNVKNFNFLRFSKYALILGVAVFVMGLTPVHADGIFDVSGAQFANGDTLTGSFSISGGTVTGSFTISGITGTFSTLVAANSGCSGGECMIEFTTGSSATPFLTLIFQGDTLADFAGGALCTSASPCIGGDFSGFSLDGETFDNGDGNLTAGSIVSASEPSTYLLLFSGLVGLGLLSRKRLMANTNA